jgi:hypothetical protein
MHDLRWSPTEKGVVLKAFEHALQLELRDFTAENKNMAANDGRGIGSV